MMFNALYGVAVLCVGSFESTALGKTTTLVNIACCCYCCYLHNKESLFDGGEAHSQLDLMSGVGLDLF